MTNANLENQLQMSCEKKNTVFFEPIEDEGVDTI